MRKFLHDRRVNSVQGSLGEPQKRASSRVMIGILLSGMISKVLCNMRFHDRQACRKNKFEGFWLGMPLQYAAPLFKIS
ncbi:hypothetical protein G7A66_13110 [Altererythrobacter sp. SALINAS58]|uniref:hypothetical protein n=1 Tax=Alteripontixanthobacter muriae TaxID=2705546 RepID=UPI001576D679|nr:hypothetical protein [Alteripontixanthobacter muriae]NTZ44001.1 hypothetical protein [Alteripontixanthobacter muriae]